MSKDTLDRLKERSEASGESVGREIDYAVREADGDHGRLRHAVGNALGSVPFQCVQIRESTRHPDVLAAVGVIEGCMAAARATLARPAGEGAGRGTG